MCLCYDSLLLWLIILIKFPSCCSCGLLTTQRSLRDSFAAELPETQRAPERPRFTSRFGWFFFPFSPPCHFRIAHFQGDDPGYLKPITNFTHRSVSSWEKDNQVWWSRCPYWSSRCWRHHQRKTWWRAWQVLVLCQTSSMGKPYQNLARSIKPLAWSWREVEAAPVLATCCCSKCWKLDRWLRSTAPLLKTP